VGRFGGLMVSAYWGWRLWIGLAIAQAIAQNHGGLITVTSQVEVGSCFTVRFPACARSWLSIQFSQVIQVRYMMVLDLMENALFYTYPIRKPLLMPKFLRELMIIQFIKS